MPLQTTQLRSGTQIRAHVPITAWLLLAAEVIAGLISGCGDNNTSV